jgi:hypothetical protein
MRFTTGRDIAHDVRHVIDEEIIKAGPTWSAGYVALRVVERLREEDPELLTKWLETLAIGVVRKEITDIARLQKHEARRQSISVTTSVFSSAVERYEKGETRALAAWMETVYVVNTENSRKKLRDMDHDDLLYAASDYTDRARANAMQAAFLRAVAEKVGAKTVGEVYDDEELTRLWRSLT